MGRGGGGNPGGKRGENSGETRNLGSNYLTVAIPSTEKKENA